MRMSLLLISLLSFQFAQAGLGGDWTGFGSWKFKGEGEGAQCSPMTMKWTETAKSIAITSGLFDCEVVAMHLDETKWNIEDGKLFDDSHKEVGSYDGQNFQAYMPSPNEKTMIHISAKREANHYDYQEVWFNQDEKVYVIEGRLFTGGN